ncbi:GAF domain-containing protein [bacterium]|nr:GAF domain-containing protein [bacterium]
MFDDITQHINIWSLFPLLGSIANFILAILVYLKSRKNPVNITFAFLNLSSAAWNLGLFKVYSTDDENLALFWMGKIVFPTVAFLPALFFHFVLVITNNFTRWKKKLTFAVYALGFVLSIIAIYDSHLYIKALPKYNWGYYHESGFFNHVYNFIYVFLSVYGCYLLFKEYRATKSAIRKNQFRYLLLGVGIALFGGTFNFPLVVHMLKIYPVGNMINLLYSALVTYAIIRYRLMEINVFLKKGTFYLTAFAFVVAVLVLILHLSPKTFGIKLLLSTVVTISAFVLIRLYPKMHIPAGRVLPSEEPDSTTKIEQLGNQILSTTGWDVNELIEDTFDDLIEILGLLGGCFFLLGAGGEKYDIVYATGCCSNSESNASIPYDSSLIDILSAQREPIVKEELELRASHGTSGQSEKKKLLEAAAQLDEFRIAVCIPLITRGNTIGLLNLGPKKSGRLFSHEELNKLAHIGWQIATALDHAKLLEESRNRAKEQEILSRIASEMMLIHDPIELEQQIFTYIGDIIDYDRCFYLRRSDEKESLVLEYAEGFDESAKELLKQIPLEVGNRRNAKAKPCVSEANISHDESGTDFYAEQITKVVENYLGEKKVKQSEEFSFVIPISVERKLYGVFCVFRWKMAYTEEQKRLLRVVASQIIALHERMSSTLARAETGAMTRALRGIAHDMSHALGILRGSFDLLKARLSEMPEVDQRVTSMINSEVERLNMVLTELKKLTDKENIRLRQEDVNAALNSALQLLESRLSILNIEVIPDLQEYAMLVLIPAGQLTRILFNLLLNAIEAMPQGGVLKLTTKLIARHDAVRAENSEDAPTTSAMNIVEITISDTGCGISDRDLNNIFRTGFTTKATGSGLGLAEVKRIINMCGGKIEVHSQLGVGTTFVIQVPCHRHL